MNKVSRFAVTTAFVRPARRMILSPRIVTLPWRIAGT